MRSMIIALLGFGLLLAGCDQLGKITPESIAAEITKDCGIVVTIADIAALISANPTAAGIAAIAKTVCGAFHAQTVAGKAGLPKGGVLNVNGVDVHYVVK